jgi:hypothetical protein
VAHKFAQRLGFGLQFRRFHARRRPGAGFSRAPLLALRRGCAPLCQSPVPLCQSPPPLWQSRATLAESRATLAESRATLPESRATLAASDAWGQTFVVLPVLSN